MGTKVASTSISPTSSTTLNEVDMEGSPSLSSLEIGERLEVMRKQEDSTYFCIDYLKETTFPGMIDELCRTKMLTWCFQGADLGMYSRNTVVIAMSYLDRFLSSDTPKAMSAIKIRKNYQLACMTSLYMAIKLFEPYDMDTATLVLLSKNSFTALEFSEMEFDILSALSWHVHGKYVH